LPGRMPSASTGDIAPAKARPIRTTIRGTKYMPAPTPSDRRSGDFVALWDSVNNRAGRRPAFPAPGCDGLASQINALVVGPCGHPARPSKTSDGKAISPHKAQTDAPRLAGPLRGICPVGRPSGVAEKVQARSRLSGPADGHQQLRELQPFPGSQILRSRGRFGQPGWLVQPLRPG
jgi:hypothetical protein